MVSILVGRNYSWVQGGGVLEGRTTRSSVSYRVVFCGSHKPPDSGLRYGCEMLDHKVTLNPIPGTRGTDESPRTWGNLFCAARCNQSHDLRAVNGNGDCRGTSVAAVVGSASIYAPE